MRGMWTPTLCLWLGLWAPPPAEVIFNPQAVARRDGLVRAGDARLHGLGERWIAGVERAELDGQPPAEWVVHVQESTGEGTWSDELHAYGLQGRAVRRLGAPFITGGYRDAGWWAPVWLGPGPRQQVLVVGDTDGTQPSDLHVLTWRRDRFVDSVWGEGPGVEVVPVTLDGTPVILGLPAPLPPSEAPRALALQAQQWRPVQLADPVGAAEEGLHAYVFEGPGRRPAQALPGLVRWLRAQGASVAGDGLWPGVRDRLAQPLAPWQHAAWLQAVAWPDSPAVAVALRPWLDAPLHDGVWWGVAEALAWAGDDADRAAVLMAADAWGRDVNAWTSRFDAVAQAFDAAGEGAHFDAWHVARARQGLGAVRPAALPDTASGLRAWLVALAQGPATARVDLEQAARWPAGAWAAPVVPGALAALMAAPEPAVRGWGAALAASAGALGPQLAAQRVAQEPAPAVLRALRAVAPEAPAWPRVAVRLLAGLAERPPAERVDALTVIAAVGGATGQVALSQVRNASELNVFVGSPVPPAAVVAQARALWAAGAPVAGLLRALRSVEHPDLQAWRAQILVAGAPDERTAVVAAWPPGAPLRPLTRGLDGEKADAARMALVEALAARPGLESQAALTRALGEETSRHRRGRILAALVQAGGGQIAQAELAGRLASTPPDCDAAITSVRVLGHAGHDRTLAVLAQALKGCPSEDRRLVEAALEAAELRPVHRVIAERFVDHPDRSVRRWVDRALREAPATR